MRVEIATSKRVIQILALVMTFGQSLGGQSVANHHQSEQTSFGAEAIPGEVLVKNPVEVPKTALLVLQGALSRGALNCVRFEKVRPEEIPSSWFVASEIHLDGPNEIDLIIRPQALPESPSPNRCLFGAHAVPFWILVKADEGYRLLLKTTGDALQIMDQRTRGYRDIEVWSLTAATRTALILKFDGNRYQLAERRPAPRK
ncbi:MAG: hypothetical protein WB460_08460 [Candidatus Acidiferrales bacterium]